MASRLLSAILTLISVLSCAVCAKESPCSGDSPVKGVVSGIIITDDVTTVSVKEAVLINWIVSGMNDSGRAGTPSCPYGSLRIAFMTDGGITEILYATDDCGTFRCNGCYYRINSDGFNQGLRSFLREKGINDHRFQSGQPVR